MIRPLRFLSLALLAATTLPAADAPPVPVSVQCEWIRLPHAAANAVIRQHLKSTESTVLHNAVIAMLRDKTAARLDVQSLLTCAGQRAKVEGTTGKAFATSFDPPQLSQTMSVDGDWPFDLAVPACAGSFSYRELGREMELETTLTKNGPPLQLNLYASWTGHLADTPYGSGISFYSQPAFYRASIVVNLRCASGVWQLAGLFTPPPDKMENAVSAPLPGDRVMLFARATAPGVKLDPNAAPDSEPAMLPVLAEWIEADTELIAGLLEAAPDFTSAAGLRASLDGPLREKAATLVETSYAPVAARELVKVSSVRQLAYPTEVDPAQVPQTLTVTNRTPAGAPLPGGGVQPPLMTPSFFNAYTVRDFGTVLEVRCFPQNDGADIDLIMKAELSTLAGGDVFGQGVAEVPQPRFHDLHCSTGLSLKPGVPALAGILDPPLPFGQAQPAVRTRKLLLFVTVLP